MGGDVKCMTMIYKGSFFGLFRLLRQASRSHTGPAFDLLYGNTKI